MKRSSQVVFLAVLASSAAVRAEVKCWAPLREEDSVGRPAFRALRRATLEAERIVRGNAAFLAAPEPVRGRTTISAGPTLPDARLHVTAYPEKSPVGLQVWTGKCEVIPQADRIAAGAGQVSIFFDHGIAGSFLGGHARPELTGRYGGYPEYNGWIVITKGGRLPWIPQRSSSGWIGEIVEPISREEH